MAFNQHLLKVQNIYTLKKSPSQPLVFGWRSAERRQHHTIKKTRNFSHTNAASTLSKKKRFTNKYKKLCEAGSGIHCCLSPVPQRMILSPEVR